jgi:dienelactone hydrolase
MPAVRTELLAFYSDGIRLEGLLQLPDAATRPLPAVLLCSGFQGLKEIIPAKLWGPLTGAGFACFAFDYRGFGSSGGERGRVIPGEQVEDVRSALTLVQQRPEVDPARVALLGWGFGGGVVVQAGAEDARAAAVVCLNGIGDGGRAVRATRTAGDWARVQALIAGDRLAPAPARARPAERAPPDRGGARPLRAGRRAEGARRAADRAPPRLDPAGRPAVRADRGPHRRLAADRARPRRRGVIAITAPAEA